MIKHKTSNCQNGEIGRHKSFKSFRSFDHEGSSPSSGTNNFLNTINMEQVISDFNNYKQKIIDFIAEQFEIYLKLNSMNNNLTLELDNECFHMKDTFQDELCMLEYLFFEDNKLKIKGFNNGKVIQDFKNIDYLEDYIYLYETYLLKK